MTENSKPARGAVRARLVYSEWEVNLARFVALRAITFIGMLAALLFLFIVGAESAELFFYFVIVLAWFAGSFLIEALVVAVGRTLKLRCALFAMADLYLMLSLFSNVGGAMLPAVSAFAGYVLLASVSCGLLVGVLSAAIGIIAFVQGYMVNTDVGSDTLIFTAFIAVAALACAALWKSGVLHPSSGKDDGFLDGAEATRLSKENEELGATVSAMQEQLLKITKERDDAMLRLDNKGTEDNGETAGSEPPAEEQPPQQEPTDDSTADENATAPEEQPAAEEAPEPAVPEEETPPVEARAETEPLETPVMETVEPEAAAPDTPAKETSP